MSVDELTRQWRAGATLQAFDQVTALGWDVSTRWMRRAVTVATVLAVPCVAGVAAVTTDLATAAAGDAAVRSGPALAQAAVLAGTGYLLCLGLFRHAVTRQRDVVADPAHGDLYRALDLAAVTVLAVRVGVPVLRRWGLVLVVAAVVAARTGGSAGTSTLLLVPVAAAAVELAVATRLASTVGAGSLRRTLPVLLVAVAGLVLAGRVLSGARPTTGAVDLPSGDLVAAFWLRLAALLVLVVATWVVVLGVRRVHATGLGVRAAAVPARRATAWPGVPAWLVGATVRELLRGRPGRVRRRLLLASVVLAAAGLGLRPLLDDLPAHLLVSGATTVTFVVALSLAETATAVVGPVAWRDQRRWAWELGASRGALAGAAVAVPVLDAALAGVAVATVLLVATGSTDPALVAVAGAAGAAAVVADALAPSRRAADGTSAPTTTGAALTVLLAVPAVVAAVAAHGTARGVLVTATAALLVGGGVACVVPTVTTSPR